MPATTGITVPVSVSSTTPSWLWLALLGGGVVLLIAMAGGKK
jgi:hypothetical protein